MQWPDVAKIEWGTILLFGGGLTLGHMLEDSGAAKVFGEMIFQSGITNIYILLPLIIVICILLSEFASNTAATAILVPLVIGSAEALNLSANLLETLVLCVAFSASFGFMLPVSTPPNAIVYGTGKIRSSDMIHTGAWFDISGAIVIATLVLVGLI
jgi:sodium-dependent dicarboxylate transporter 2/3/5